MWNSSIVPIPPAYDNNENIDGNITKRYLEYLYNHGVEVVCTTAGTSQFNLLEPYEIVYLNSTVLLNSKKCILGFPALPVKQLRKHRFFDLNKFKIKPYGVMLLYPDRYYGETAIVDYFHEIADEVSVPCWIHGQFMRDAINGGTYNYTASLINKIKAHPNVVGMKEECTSFEGCYDVCRQVSSDSFTICVAGKSMRRFILASHAGGQTFLAGLGSLRPDIENAFLRSLDAEGYVSNILELENRFFETMFEEGWHVSLRYAISELGFQLGNRKPFHNFLSDATRSKIKDFIHENTNN